MYFHNTCNNICIVMCMFIRLLCCLFIDRVFQKLRSIMRTNLNFPTTKNPTITVLSDTMTKNRTPRDPVKCTNSQIIKLCPEQIRITRTFGVTRTRSSIPSLLSYTSQPTMFKDLERSPEMLVTKMRTTMTLSDQTSSTAFHLPPKWKSTMNSS